MALRRRRLYLDGVLHAGSFVYAALTDGVGPDADVLFDLVGVGELRRAPVQLLRVDKQTLKMLVRDYGIKTVAEPKRRVVSDVTWI